MHTALLLAIPAAGFGIRMNKIARGRPKELLPLAGRPAILYALVEGLDAGLAEAAVIIRAGKEDIRRVLEEPGTARRIFPAAAEDIDALRARLKLTFLYQREPRGEADAVLAARDLADGRDLAVVYPDNLHLPHPGALRTLLAARTLEARNLCALSSVRPELAKGVSNSGRVDLLEPAGGLVQIRRFLPKRPGPLPSPAPPASCVPAASSSPPAAISPPPSWPPASTPHAELTDGKVRRLMQARGRALLRPAPARHRPRPRQPRRLPGLPPGHGRQGMTTPAGRGLCPLHPQHGRCPCTPPGGSSPWDPAV